MPSPLPGGRNIRARPKHGTLSKKGRTGIDHAPRVFDHAAPMQKPPTATLNTVSTMPPARSKSCQATRTSRYHTPIRARLQRTLSRQIPQAVGDRQRRDITATEHGLYVYPHIPLRPNAVLPERVRQAACLATPSPPCSTRAPPKNNFSGQPCPAKQPTAPTPSICPPGAGCPTPTAPPSRPCSPFHRQLPGTGTQPPCRFSARAGTRACLWSTVQTWRY